MSTPSASLSNTGNRRGEILANRIGIEIIGQEGHDLKCACVACDSSDAMRVHAHEGVAFCFSCEAKWSRLQLATDCLGDQDAAWELLESIGFEQPRQNGQGATSSVDPIEAVACLKQVSADSLRAYGARAAKRGGQPCARFPVYNALGEEAGYFDILTSGGKGLFKKGGKQGLFFPGKIPKSGEIWLIVEGVKDAAALHALGHNAAGLPGSQLPIGFARLFQDVNVIIIPDRDSAGQSGGENTAANLHGVASGTRIVTLPVEYRDSGGADVRDVLRLKDGGALLRQALDDAGQWRPPHSDGPGSPEGGGSQLPEVILPGGKAKIIDCAKKLGELMKPRETHYVRGGSVTSVLADSSGKLSLVPVKPARLASDFEHVALLKKIIWINGVEHIVPATCSESNAKLIGDSTAFQDALPELRVLSNCPVLIEQDGALVDVHGYDAMSGVLASGPASEDVSLEIAPGLLNELLADFQFASDSDRSRALAALITPALVLGGLLPGRAPIDLGEADQSQTGKGFRNKITTTIYRQEARTVNQRRGVASLEDAFDRALISGASFIAIDNVRGKIDSPALECFMTENSYSARSAYCPVTMIDPRRVIVMFTSNKSDITRDLANRCSCVRMLKQHVGYRYAEYPEGDLLAHVAANQPRYLGAVFAVVRAWHAEGKPRTTECRHDFRAWAQILDWIVQNLLHAAPLIDGHQETQERMTNPALNWLRDVTLIVLGVGKAGQWLRAHQILDLIDQSGNVEIPGLKDECSLEDTQVHKTVLTAMGRRFKQCFSERESVEIDNLCIERSESLDENSRRRFEYRFLSPKSSRDDRLESLATPPSGTNEEAKAVSPDCPSHAVASPEWENPARAPREPRDGPAIKHREPRDPREGTQYRVGKADGSVFQDPLCTVAGIAGDTGDTGDGLVEPPVDDLSRPNIDDDEWGEI